MFKRLRIKLTLMCSIITAVILVCMSAGLLAIAEQQLALRARESFASGFNAVFNYITSQKTFRYLWLAQTEADENLMIRIEENGRPFLYDSLRSSQNRSYLFEQAKQAEQRLYSSQPSQEKRLFEFRTDDNARYFAGTSTVNLYGETVRIFAIQPLALEDGRIRGQRQAFGGLVILAVAFLFIFSYFFTARAIRPVEESQRRQVAFVSAASHELRSPLAVINASVSSIQKAPPDKAKRFFQIIASECGRMSRLVNDLLTLARADNGKWSIHSETVNLDSVILAVCENYETLARGKQIQVSFLPPEGVLLWCHCDPERIEQVLGILLDNAICYTPPGGDIRLSAEASRGWIRVHVTDNGPGIPDNLKSHVFERFYRMDDSHSSKEHFGLGLSIAAEIAALHGGRMTLADAPGGGCSFTLWLPAEKPGRRKVKPPPG